MLSIVKGVVGPKDLSRIIKQLLKLDGTPAAKLATNRWVVGENTLVRLFRTARRIFAAEGSLLEDVPLPSVFVGDLHGDLQTLLNILKENGLPPTTNYVFLGDYVDRGQNSMEVLILVLALKCRYPDHVTVLRGNHETDVMTRAYGFHTECAHRYSTYMYDAAVKTFQMMPLAAIVGRSVLAVHGGLSPKMQGLDDIRGIERPCNVAPGTLIADLLWSDPTFQAEVPNFAPGPRGCGSWFGKEATDAFLDANGLSLLVRGHEACFRGARRHHGRCWTVFSHPAYCGEQNAAAVLVITQACSVTSRLYTRSGDTSAYADWPVDAEAEPRGADMEESDFECGCDDDAVSLGGSVWSVDQDAVVDDEEADVEGEPHSPQTTAVRQLHAARHLLRRDPTSAKLGGAGLSRVVAELAAGVQQVKVCSSELSVEAGSGTTPLQLSLRSVESGSP